MPESQNAVAPTVIEAVPESKKQRPCDVCAQLIEVEAKYCTHCESYQNGKPCVLCGKYMPPRAACCPACSRFQDWRRHLSGDTAVLALLVSLFSVAGAAIPAVMTAWNKRSQTTAMVLKTDIDPKVSSKSIIFVRAINSGGRPALVRDVQLDLKPVKASVDLEILNMEDTEVPGANKTDLRLFAEKVTLDRGQSKKCVMDMLARTDITLTLVVDERNRLGTTIESQKIPAVIRGNSRLGESLREWTAQRITEDSGGGCP